MTDVLSGAFSAGFEGAVEQRYQLLDEVRTGGMGQVTKALDTRMRRFVAIKRGRADIPDAEARLRREARAGALLFHPHIVPILDAQEDASGLWLVLPWLEGPDFGGLVANRPAALRALLAVSEAMAYAHSKGVIHRDLKPQNILNHEGRPLIIDWGLSRSEGDSAPTLVTRTGIGVGTPGYMAPEQATGAPTDARSDVWALGALLALVLTGKEPDPAFWMHGSTAPMLPDGVLGELATRCLSRHPDDRPSAADVAGVLRKALRPAMRSRWPLTLGAGGLVLGAALAASSFSHVPEPPSEHAAGAMEELAWRELREGREQRAAGWARRASTLPQTPGLKGLALIPTSPTAHTTLDLSPCLDVELSPDGASLLCLADGQQTYLNVETGAVRWQRPLPTVPDWFVSPEGVVLVSNNNLLSIANDGSQRDLGYLRQLDVVAVHDDRVIIHNGDRHGVPTPAGGPLLPTIPSQARINFLWSHQDDTWWVGGRHTVLQIDPVSGAVLQSIDHHLGEHLLAILPVPEGFLAMGMRGTYRTYAWSGQPLGLPEHLAHAGLVSDAVSNGPWLATNGAKSGVQLWNRHTGARIRQVQPAPARALSMTEHALLVANEHLDSVPLEGRGQAWEVTGLASIARRGEEIWATVGGEIVGLLPDARQRIPLPGFGTVKTVVPFEGGWLVAGVGHPVSTTGHRVPAGLQAVVLRDLVALADGWMVGAPFTGGPEVVRADEHRSEFQRPSQSYRRMVVSHDRRSVVLVTDAGEVERLLITAAGEPTKERIGSFPGVRFGVPIGDETWLFMVDGEVRRSNREAPDWTFDGKLTAVAVDDRYLYLGTADGLVEIRNFEGQLLARLRAHDELVCTLLPDGDDLFTASWDSTIRRFDLSKL